MANSRVLPEARPAGQPGDRHAGVGQTVGDEQRGAVAFEVGIGRHDQLADRARSDAGLEGVDGQLFGAHALERGEPAEQDVVDAVEGAGLLQGHEIAGLLDDADGRVSRRGSRQMAQSGCSASVRWKQTWQCRISILGGPDRLGQLEGLLGRAFRR